MKAKYLILALLIVIAFSITSCCGYPDKDSIEIKFTDNNGYNIFLDTIYYDIDSVSINNNTDNQTVNFSFSKDTSIIIYDIENEFYPKNNYGIESTKELCIYFSFNNIDTINCSLLINLEGRCKYDRLKYAEIEYNNITYSGEIENSTGYFKNNKK